MTPLIKALIEEYKIILSEWGIPVEIKELLREEVEAGGNYDESSFYLEFTLGDKNKKAFQLPFQIKKEHIEDSKIIERMFLEANHLLKEHLATIGAKEYA